jgi:hypothetical protein
MTFRRRVALPPELAAAAASEGARADAEDRIEAEITARDTLRRRADALGLRLPVEARSSTQLRAELSALQDALASLGLITVT